MKAIVAILCAALVALGGGVIHLWRLLDASRHQVAGLQAQVDATAASAPHGATAATTSPSPSPSLAEPIATAPAVTPTAFRNSDDVLALAMIRARSPEGRAEIKVFQRGRMPTEYPDVGKVLGLSPDEVGRLYDLLAEQANADELASLLGSKYEKWQKYTIELPTRRQVNDLAAALSAAGAPLSDAQRDSLMPAVVAAEKRNTQERAAKFGQGSKAFVYSRFSPEANQKILDAAASYLTPQQLESYRQLLERGSSMQMLGTQQ